jgi:glycerol kinase
MSEKYILVIDEGTTGTRSLIFDHNSQIKSLAYTEFTQYNPAPDRVEHDAEEIWEKTVAMTKKALEQAGLTPADIDSVAVTNQRCTAVLWDRHTGKPVSRAFVWQDTRTRPLADRMASDWRIKLLDHTGTNLHPVNSSFYVHWMLENNPGLSEKAAAGDLAFGTIDSWLIYKLTGGKVHAIAASNASASGTYDIPTGGWFTELIEYLGLPMSLYPEIKDDSGYFGDVDPELFGGSMPITSAVGDQQAALFGQNCLEPGTVKCTHGTGTFLDMNIGTKPTISYRGLNSLVAWRMGGVPTFMLEGYAAVTGSAVQWLRDGAEMISSSSETEALATSVPDNGGVYFVPALAGLAAPYWDPQARGMIIGITRGTSRAHLVRATLEGIVYATKDFLETMRQDSGVTIKSIKVDGGAAKNDFLMQFQADLLDAEVVRPVNPEATSLGAAYMAGLCTGFWKHPQECFANAQVDKSFQPQMSAEQSTKLYAEWTKAVQRTMGWTG